MSASGLVAAVLAIFVAADVGETILYLFSPAESRTVDCQEFSAQIKKIDDIFEPDTSRIGEITHILDHVNAFSKLALSDSDLVDQALTYFAQPGHTPLERRIAVHAVQKVPVSEWVRFANVMLDSYDKNQIDIWELEDTIFPRRFFSQHPTDDFWRPDVRHILYRLYFAHDIDRFDENLRARVIDCLTGLDTLQYLLFYCPRCA